MGHLSRRRFLQTTSAAFAGATFAISGTKSSGNVLGANDTVRIAVAGLNGRGGAHVGEYAGVKGLDIVYVVDPDKRTWNSRIKQIESRGGSTPKAEQDIRKVLEDKNVDVVSIATPNHWHSLMTIWACEAGKDVYVEKPMSHNIHEGRIAVETARKHKRIVQHGTQSRSEGGWHKVVAAIRSGKLGKLQVARALCYKGRGSIGFKQNAEAPSELDFNLWLGPATERPFNGNLVHYNWHWFWDFGNGDLGNQGVHQMDIARWGLGKTLPIGVTSVGGRWGYKDQGETANTQIVVLDYGDDQQLIFEVRGLKTDKYMNQAVGNIFHLEGGTIAGQTFYPKGSDKPAPLPEVEIQAGPGKGNFHNFIAAVRSRKQEDLNADILEGHYSSACCHLGNVSYRLGSEVDFSKDKKVFASNQAAAETLERTEEHLLKDGIKLEEIKLRVGRTLAFDPKTERFADSDANALLTRKPREGFAVPQKV